MKTLLISLLLCCTVPSLVVADTAEHEMPPPYTGSSALEKIKALAGDWTGTVAHGAGPNAGKKEDTTVSYRVTSNGSAVVETIFEGTPMEMTSVYYDRDGKLAMTHYCAVANRPLLSLTKESKSDIVLSYLSGEELDPKKDMHISGLEIELKGTNQMVQRWKGLENGAVTHSTVVELTRAVG